MLSLVLIAILLVSAPIRTKDTKLDSLLIACQKHQDSTEIMSLNLLLIYVNNFTSAWETEELIKLGQVWFFGHRTRS